MKNVFRHLINLLARVWFFFTKASYISSFQYGVDDRTATISLPGTKFAELYCERDGFKPIRFTVGKVDSSTAVIGLDTGCIKLQCGDKTWNSSISSFLAGLHFSR